MLEHRRAQQPQKIRRAQERIGEPRTAQESARGPRRAQEKTGEPRTA